MTLKLKLLLFLCVVLAGIYATTPLWLSFVLARQLPPGWQVEKLDSAYPGLTGIKLNYLLVKGEFPDTGMILAASDIQLGYRGPAAAIGSLSLEVRPRVSGDRTATAPTLDDLSLPIIRTDGKLADISVAQLHVTIYRPANTESGHGLSMPLLVLNFNDFRLLPRPDNGFHLTAGMEIGEFSSARGSLAINTDTDSLKADIRFPADPATPPWLVVALEQLDSGDTATTRIQAVFDAGLIDQQWLDSILTGGTGGMLTHADGQLELQADFTGRHQQDIEHVSLAAKKLQVVSHRGVLDLEAELLASREGDTVTVSLPTAAKIEYRDNTGWIDDFIHSVVPGLQRTPRPVATGLLVFDPGSKLAFQHRANPSARFDGGIGVGLAASGEDFHVRFDNLQAEMADSQEPLTLTADGLVTLHWEQQAPVAYTSADLDLKADQLSLSNTGRLRISPEAISFEQSGDFTAEFTNLQTSMQTGQSLRSDQFKMQGRIDFEQSMSAPGAPVDLHFNGPVSAHNMRVGLPGDGHSPPMTVTADDLSATLDVVSGDGILVSTGSGTWLAGRINQPATSAASIDMTWQDFDLVELAGNLTTRTQGFATELEGETWAGFDLDLDYELFSNADASGTGTLMFANGPQLPFEFSGNIQAERWDISLPAATVKLAQLRRLLRAAHFELPAAIKLTDGYIELQGTVAAGDNIAANMSIGGHDVGASMQESSARNASFLLNTSYDQSMSASGPVSIELIALAGGIDMTNVRADIEIENMETFGLQNLHAELFDGQLMLHKLRYSTSKLEDSAIELKQINLGHLLAFADIDGLEGTGTLEISLPVSSDSTGILIKNGTFESSGPGRLAYKKEGLAGSNIGLQALQNFQYQVLSGTVDYHSDGSYRMSIHLEGKNPDLYGGHPVVFNLTINGSLPALFEALFMTGDFEESILKQLRIKQPE